MARTGEWESHAERSALRIALLYALFASLWILLSDRLLGTLVRDPDRLAVLQIAKGWAFVAVTAVLLFWMVRRSVARMDGAFRALADTRRVHDTLLANLPGMVYRCRNDRDWTMEVVSEGCRELTGRPPEAFVGNREIAYGDLIHAEDREGVWNEVQASVAARRTYQIVYRIKDTLGETRWVWEQGRGVFDAEGNLQGLEGVILDITERKSLERQLQQAQKMEAIARLVGGIAHDFNNLLTVINGYAEIVLKGLPEGHEHRRRLEQVIDAADRASALIRRLQETGRAREEGPRPEAIPVNEAVERTAGLYGRILGDDVRITFHLDSAAPRVRVAIAEVEQILANLLINARDAMPDGGTISIETATARIDEGAASRILGHPPAGSYVMLVVSDTGTGMNAAVQARLFDPFFTTKGPEKGTGLGLSTVWGIVRQGGGGIWVYSKEGQGTTFKVYLPVAGEGSAVQGERPVDVRAPSSSATILVVDDEKLVLDLVATVLRERGFRVLEAASPAEAVRICETLRDRIDLLITDVVLPEMSGLDLVRLVRKLRPGIRTLVMSGYTSRALIEQGVFGEEVVFLEKPISVVSLVEMVGQSFGNPSS